jgi:hypothetical protein
MYLLHVRLNFAAGWRRQALHQGVYRSKISADGAVSESRTRTPIDLFTYYLYHGR